MIRLIDGGLRSILVDSGRSGVQSAGFCQSGPMDDNAFWWGNYLVGNVSSSPQIEVMGTGKFVIEKDGVIAVTGRDCRVSINDIVVDSWRSILAKKGDVLEFSALPMGARSYLAVGGEWRVPLAIGSACTVARENLGGLLGDGSPLKANDVIEINPRTVVKTRCLRAQSIVPSYTKSSPIDVVLGYQCDTFSTVSQRVFFSSCYTVTNKIDRMGYRLSGLPVVSSLTTMRSEGINLGDIQCPPDGQPIVMMRDRQTLGGYPKIGAVASYDIYRLAQAVPGETVTFRQIDMNNARAKYQLHLARRKKLIGENGCP